MQSSPQEELRPNPALNRSRKNGEIRVPNAETKKPKAYYASLLHDALHQFSIDGLPAPLDRRAEIDRIFLDLLQRQSRPPPVRICSRLVKMLSRLMYTPVVAIT